MVDPVTEVSVLATSSMALMTDDPVWTLEVGTTQKLLHTPVVCDWRWWWPLNVKWVGGLAMQTVNWVLITRTFSGYLSGNNCFLCRDFKKLCGCDDCFCNTAAKFAGISNKLPRAVVILERKKINFFTWECRCLFCGIQKFTESSLFLLVATVSFPYVPLHPSSVLLQQRSFQAIGWGKTNLVISPVFSCSRPCK